MSHAPTPALSRRHENLRQQIAARSIDALVVTTLPNILYLTNFTGSAAIVVVTAERLWFLT
ncbi:MAG TPA: aminopeptidase P family N-terminal domain-containing protein, partial [Vicinamibacterales bacterium]|nr:aminopeptidase P family N-terminal domain-containing protein [Vicinamibacterales bacterium]